MVLFHRPNDISPIGHWEAMRKFPFCHCLQGNTINLRTIEWCDSHVLGDWVYWFDRNECLDQWDYTPQIAYVGFTNSIDLFMFKMGAPCIYSDRTDLRGIHDAYC